MIGFTIEFFIAAWFARVLFEFAFDVDPVEVVQRWARRRRLRRRPAASRDDRGKFARKRAPELDGPHDPAELARIEAEIEAELRRERH